jgi:hypothetical protein
MADPTPADRLALALSEQSDPFHYSITITMILYHATTPKKARLYRETGHIIAPVRGFTSIQAAMAWAMKVGRTVIYQFNADRPHKLPDHHNAYGEAWWNDGDIHQFKCVFSADSDA